MDVYYIGHSAFLVRIEDKRFLFDPWIEGNPVAKPPQRLDADYVFVSHGHRDHGLEDAKKVVGQGAKLVGVFELVNAAGVERAIKGNIGGRIRDGEVEIYITPAFHSCPYGSPAGFIVKYKNRTLYHAGDTALFGDMRLLGERYSIDVAFLPIGGTYTMDVEDAKKAAQLLGAKIVVPMHYNTFPEIEEDPERLDIGNKVIMRPGEQRNIML